MHPRNVQLLASTFKEPPLFPNFIKHQPFLRCVKYALCKRKFNFTKLYSNSCWMWKYFCFHLWNIHFDFVFISFYHRINVSTEYGIVECVFKTISDETVQVLGNHSLSLASELKNVLCADIFVFKIDDSLLSAAIEQNTHTQPNTHVKSHLILEFYLRQQRSGCHFVEKNVRKKKTKIKEKRNDHKKCEQC